MPATYLRQGATSNELIDYEVNGIPSLRDAGLQVMRIGDPGITTEASLVYALIDQMESEAHATKHRVVEEGIQSELHSLIHQTDYIGTRGRIEAFSNVYQYDVKVFDSKGLKWVVLGFGTDENSTVITIVEHENGFYTSTVPLPDHLQSTRVQRRRQLGGRRVEYDRHEVEARPETENEPIPCENDYENEKESRLDSKASKIDSSSDELDLSSQPLANHTTSKASKVPTKMDDIQHSAAKQVEGGIVKKSELIAEEVQRKRQEAREKSKANKMKQWLESQQQAGGSKTAGDHTVLDGPDAPVTGSSAAVHQSPAQTPPVRTPTAEHPTSSAIRSRR